MRSGTIPNSTHRDRFALDLSHPGVRDHIRRVFTTLRAWGYTAFKTDFMDWGFVDSTEIRRHTPGKTSVMWFDEALRIIRDSIGPDSYWLACIAPFAPLPGYCDAMRITSDVGTHWNKPGGNGNDGVGGGIMNVLQESYHDQFFNGILWANDPDVMFLRTQNIELNETEVRSLALWSGILGGTITISDFFDDLPPERLALWRFIHPEGRPLQTARLPFWTDPGHQLYVAVRDYPEQGGHALLVLNSLDSEQTGLFSLQVIAGKETATVVQWNPGLTGPARCLREIEVTLPPHGCELFWIGEAEPPPKL